MNGFGGVALGAQRLGELVDFSFGPGKDDGLALPVNVQHVAEDVYAGGQGRFE